MKLRRSRKRIRKKRLATRQDRIMTLANMISISRMLMALPLVYYLENNRLGMSLLYIGLIILSDLLDGYVARHADEITNFGKLIDPVADKICLMVVLIYLLFEYGTPFLILIILLGARDLLLVIFATFLLSSGSEVFQSLWWGKVFITVTAAMMLLFVIGLTGPGMILYYASLILLAISTFFYFQNYRNYMKELTQ